MLAITVFISVGFLLGKLQLPISWLILFIIFLNYVESKFIIKQKLDSLFAPPTATSITRNHVDSSSSIRRRANRSSISHVDQTPLLPSAIPSTPNNTSFILTTTPGGSAATTTTSPSGLTTTTSIPAVTPGFIRRSQIIYGGENCVNTIINAIWNQLDYTSVREAVNSYLELNNPLKAIMESIAVTKMSVGTEQPTVSNFRCTQNSMDRTVIELDVAYEGDSVLEWSMRPRVLPFTVKCGVNSIIVSATIRICIDYNTEEGGIDSIQVSFSEYPEFNGQIQMFDLDINTISSAIPALKSTIQKKLQEVVNSFVYPNSFTLYSNDEENAAKRASSRGVLPLQFEIGQKDMEEVEDEIKNTILDINQVLMTKLSNISGSPSEQAQKAATAKKEVAESVLQFLKYGTQPGRIPVSMMETVKRGFQILNSLAFDDQKRGEVCTPVLDVILLPENISLIGHVCRTCTLADELIYNIMKIKDGRTRTKVSCTLNQQHLQDIVFTVLNRFASRETK